MLFFLESLSMSQKSVHLQCVFHSIRFKVNKGWSTAVLLFFMPVRQDGLREEIMKSMIINHYQSFKVL